MNKNTKKRYRVFAIILIIFLVLFGSFAIYVSDYYHADAEAIEAYTLTQNANISKEEIAKGTLAYVPEEASAGFIFYPGGKVEYTSYEPLMFMLAEKGILSVLIEMPFNLAVFDINAADGIQGQFPDVENWYIGGHSLGGSMAASYLADHKGDFAGLILLASYSTVDFSNSDLEILSIYGSEDKILNAESYEKNKLHLPKSFTAFIIEGGCHAYFGMYGEQKGDGEPMIDNTTQVQISADVIGEFVID